MVAGRRSEAVERSSAALDHFDTGGCRSLGYGPGSLHHGFGRRCDLDGGRHRVRGSKQLVLGDPDGAGRVLVDLIAQHQGKIAHAARQIEL